jgi:hypothetical protein
MSEQGTDIARRTATADQLRAVFAVMRILAEDDRERGTGTVKNAHCMACRRRRAAAGGVDYGGTWLCNGCATDYELLRMGGVVADLAAYLDRGVPIPTAG